MKKLNSLLPLLVLPLFAVGCFWGEKKTEIHQSGRLQYIEYLRFGPAGTHGSEGWYVNDREITVNGYRRIPTEIDIKNTTCEESPNQAVEALKCSSYKDMKKVIYIIRMKGDEPELVTASAQEFNKADDSGKWSDDGRWLIFRNYFFNVETSEKREIKGLPDTPDKYFIAASPDLETIVFRDFCYDFARDDSGKVVNMAEYQKQCDKFQQRQKDGIAAFWLIEAKTGKAKILELKVKDYPFAENEHEFLPVKWLTEFKSKLVWEKDENGKDRLVYPN